MVELTTKIYHELEKVFDGRNSAVNFQFKNPELSEDWEEYKKEALNEPRVWREDGWKTLQTAVNSMVVVDLPKEQSGDRPEPYFYFLGIEHVIDYSCISDGTLEYVIFNIDKDHVACYDDEHYRVFKLNKKREIEDVVVESPHDLGYCPVSFFWNDSISNKIKDLKRNPITPQLANYDWSLFFGISKRHLDLYAAYPIYSAYEADCDFSNNETQDYCDGGFLRDSSESYVMRSDGTVTQCPICTEKKIVGVGSFVDVPVPQTGEVDMKDPVSITTIDKESLDYNVGEVSRLRNNIFTSVVGTGGEVQQKAAINELQVSANYEDRTAVLNNLKVNFEKIIMFTNDTVCRLRYGSDYIGSSVDLGTEFYVHSITDLYNQFKLAKDNGATETQLNAITNQIIQTEYRNNPIQMQRMILLKELEPYVNYTRAELLDLKDKGLVDEELLRIKINFTSFVERFERENINILEFGEFTDKDNKLETITSKFKEYAKEQEIIPTGQQKTETSGNGKVE